MLTSGTGLQLVCQSMPSCSSTSYPNVRDYNEQGCHHLPPAPQPKGMRQTKVASRLDTMSTLSTTTLALARNIHLYQESSTRASTMGMDDEPTNK